jgi:tubulin alpha
MFSNSSSFYKICDELSLDFEKLYRKRAFIHWFVGEGMESGEFMECREDFAALSRDYQEMTQDTPILDEDENNSSILS